jgi:hypothetical protein
MFKSFQSFKPFKPFVPSLLPRDAGVHRGGLNGAKRLNGLNVWNRRMRISMRTLL